MKTVPELVNHLEAKLVERFADREQTSELGDQLRSEVRMFTGGLLEELIVTNDVPFDEYIIICGVKNNPHEEIASNRCNLMIVTPMGKFNINIGKITQEVHG